MHNKDLAKRWFEEIWNQKNPKVIHELLHAEGVGHTEAGSLVGPQGFESGLFDTLTAAFPDVQVELDGVIAEGKDVVVRWTAVGTNQNSLLGMVATGQKVSFSGMTWLRFVDGKIVEGWDRWNLNGLLNLLQNGVSCATVKSL
jgi:predicted ester cyclase